jgi:WD40 repeat protein
MGDHEVLWERKGHSPFMWWPGWSPNGKRLATAEMKAPTVVLMLDGDTGKEVGRMQAHKRAINAVTWKPDGKLYATAGGDGRITIRGPRGGQKAAHHVFKNESESVHWSPDGKSIAVSSRDGSVLVMDPGSGEVSFSWPPGPPVLSVAWHPKGKRLAMAREDSRVLVVKPHSAGSVMLVHRKAVNDIAWSPNGRRLATASADGSVRLWAADGTMTDMLLRPHKEGTVAVSYSPDGKRLAAASWDGAARVWYEGVLELEDRKGHGPPVAVAWRPGKEAQLLVGRSKGPLRLLELLK